ncbi:MAG: transketolase [Flavobacteriales bacterium]|nr:transketolase [Flavobacteriales bacterium]MBT3962788.1 transketolase [Flavobacteriales bacterium]MBT4704993.1 transketolase [Flavobacteriales bacterium]MBT4929768.1 transketolase [Flavobacteriales bacterium]MBT5133237.1 transketolase [Flavobacteriales bacterium]
MAQTEAAEDKAITRDEMKAEVLADYKLANYSREISLMGRREVLTGKAKFGILGDGKEVAQIALAKYWQPGDWRSGYYRDQTMMMAAGLLTGEEFFAQLYADADLEREPASAGRMMNGHYSTRTLDAEGNWTNLAETRNSSADISPTAGQMPRLLGLALASKFYRNNPELKDHNTFSNGGNDVAFGTTGDASTSEGPFWEAMNAAGVLQVPLVMSVWDDGHGISVPKEFQTVKQSISEALSGFQRTEDAPGFEIIKTKGWDYPHLILTYEKAVKIAREEQVPVLVHVEEVTQPQGHSTSGSHERYKSEERLQWEKDFDPIKKMREWIEANGIASNEELEVLEKSAKKDARDAKNNAWKAFLNPMKDDKAAVIQLLTGLAGASKNAAFINKVKEGLESEADSLRKEIIEAARKGLRYAREEQSPAKAALSQWIQDKMTENAERYSSHLYSESTDSPLKVEPVPADFSDDKKVDGREIIRENFDALLAANPELIIFGEDSGKIGGVNQGLEGLQAKYGDHRVFDVGIRECTIVGQGIGMAMRGLRPIAEIQYLDYLLYALQVLSDDLSTLQYRTKGGQKAPLIIRTRGHRLEGIWHSGSPLGMMIHSLRGMHICVPRNMTQAAGMYNTLMAGDDPAIVVESLNGYRLKEDLPSNLGEFRIALGKVETMVEGDDITIVTYGSMVRMCVEVAKQLNEVGISAEVIDAQTLLPFDIGQEIVESVKKTNRVLFVDEDVPGGASAYMMQEVLEKQGGYVHLDSAPATLSAKAHRPAYASDGDYFSKPSHDDIFEKIYSIMGETDPERFPELY